MGSTNPPWLENLSDDWVPIPGTPSPVPARSINHSRQSSLQSQTGSPSRIPIPARRPPEQSPVTDEKKRIPRPCHFVRREPPTPKGPRTPKTPSKLRSPMPDKTRKTSTPKPSTRSPKLTSNPPSESSPRASKSPKSTTGSPKPNVAAAGKQQPAVDTRSPLRSVSNVSSQSSQQNTVQVRPKKTKEGELTPEWRKRLVHGEIPTGEQRDLFAPIGLESVFKPPTPGTEATRHDQIPMMRQSHDIWNFTDSAQDEGDNVNYPATENTSESRREDGSDSKNEDPVPQEAKPELDNKEHTDASSPGSPTGALKVKKGTETEKPSHDQNRNQDPSYSYTQLRTASGLEDLRNEDITPVTFSQTNTAKGSGTSEVIKSALKHVTDKLDGLSLPAGDLPAGDRPGSRASDSVLFHPQNDPPEEPLPEDGLLDVTSNSLPQDLSMGTLDYRGRAAFARFRRTGYLGEGSFLKPRLTPSPLPSQRLSPHTLGNSRIKSSPPFYKSNPLTDPPSLPRPPSNNVRDSPTEQPAKSKEEGMPSSGSPLKLFGNHDTFTNNRLLRRMSQFEETFDNSSDDDEPVSPSEEARRKGDNRSLLSVRPESGRYSSRRSRFRASITPQLNRFGEGGLDNFDFSDTSPYEPKLLYNEIPDPKYRTSSRRRSSITRRHFRRTSLDNPDQEHKLFDSLASGRSGPKARQGTEPDPAEGDFLGYVEVKQASKMASREKNPKRRRTILKSGSSDSENRDVNSHLGLSNHLSLLQRSLMQHGIEHTEVDHLAQSHSTERPRTPTPSQARSTRKRSSSHWNQSNGIANDHTREESPQAMQVPKVKVTGINDEKRKGSITTQDYLNEATKVMDMIRSKGGVVGGLPSLEELDMEDEEDDEESTREEFSRPPSRDGIDLRKLRESNKEPNPRVLSHLKKFQENDDPDFGVSTSVASLDLDQDQQPESSREGKSPKDWDFKDGEHSLVDEEDENIDRLSFHTQMSAKSIPTGSSSTSHAKGVLSSDLVSHLIPEQVNGFTYDRFKHQWVKEQPRRSPEKAKGDDSEDDPFRDIPDLSVDERQEMERMQESSSPNKNEDASYTAKDYDPDSPLGAKVRNLADWPQTRDGAPSVTASTVQSKGTRFTSSVPNSGTRATSWDTDDQPKHREVSSEVEHEIQLHEGRLSKPPRRQNSNNQQARVVTISFSSPLVSHVAHSDDHNGENPDDVQAPQTEHADREEQPSMLPLSHLSVDGHSSTHRSISRIDEADEDRAEDENLSVVRHENAEGTVATPLKTQAESSLLRFRETEADSSFSFHLDTLPDFTVNQIDRALQREPSYVAQRTHPTSLRQIHGTFALATEDLVKHLTEVEPFEPYWEHVRRLILRDKGLMTLHKLSDFCPRLEDLDVSDNDIGQLDGIPASLRTLRIQRNFLSSLTAWGHLVNLQYLDVSGNDLENLDGFGGLIHLREIRANDNNIRNIDGILDLNGLLSLKLSNNSLATVGFEGSELTRLNELDLSHNELTTVQNLDFLPALSTLNLSFNQLNSVNIALMPNLRALKLSNNRLHALDTAMLPSLALLYADHNWLSTITGLEQCHSLEILSAREQVMPEKGVTRYFDIDLGLVRDIRKVFLSSNKLSTQSVSPSVPLLSLQLFDIASCKLENLPSEFALNFPNVKVLNLNFNALTGVTELAGMNCLSRLTIAGNRIMRMRRLCQALSRIGRTRKNSVCSLQKVDLRGNPLTVRFYPPAVTGSGRDESKKLHAKEAERPRGKASTGVDLSAALANIEHGDDNIAHPALWGEDAEKDREIGINDPYTLPPADLQADMKYFSHLDEPTRLRRKVLELMIYAGTSGSIKYLDGLEFRPMLEEGSDMDHAWTRLEQLGVLRKKAITT